MIFPFYPFIPDFILVKKLATCASLSGKQIVQMMKDEGYLWFTTGDLTASWKSRKNGREGYGVQITKSQWLWYENWLPEIRKYCQKENPIRIQDMSEDSLLPNEVVKILKEQGFHRFNTTWLGYWEEEKTVDRNDSKNGHYGKGGRYYWHRNIIPSVLEYCNDNKQRLE